MTQNIDYFAFISYKSDDVEWAIWLQHELEHYHLPNLFNGRTDIRQELRPVFRDIDELSAGNLPKQIQQALARSQNLIVICSPQAAISPWVNMEVETFISMGKTSHIFPFIVEGSSPTEFYPPALLNLPNDEERLGGHVCKNGRDAAFIKVVAGMLGLSFDSLWNRYEKEKVEEERKAREQRDYLLRVQSRFIAEKAKAINDDGNSYLARRLLLEVLPKDLKRPNRPYTIEAELSFRHSCQCNSFIFDQHAAPIVSASFSPDGKRILSASRDNKLYIWDVCSGRCKLALCGHTGRIKAAFFSSDGQYVVSVSSWGHYYPSLTSVTHPDEIRIWNSISGEIVQIINWPNSSIEICSISHNNKYVVMTSRNSIYVWDTMTGKLLHQLEGHKEFINNAIFSPDGRTIVSTSFDKTIRIWDITKGQTTHILEGHSKFVSTIAFSSDGKRIVSAARDNTVRIWDVLTGSLIHVLYGHTNEVYDASFDCTNQFVASASADNTVRIWDADTGYLLHSLNHNSTVYSINFSPDGKNVLSVSNNINVRLWDVASGNLIKTFKCRKSSGLLNGTPVKAAIISPTGNHILAISNSNIIHLWDAKERDSYLSLQGHSGPIYSVSYSHDDRFLASASADGTVRIWNIKTGKTIQILGHHTACVKSVAFNSNDTYIASASLDGIIYIWCIQTGTLIHSWKGHSKQIRSIRFHPKANIIITSSDDNQISIWDIQTTKLLHTILNDCYVYSASFSYDGNYIVSASFDRKIRVWDASTLNLLHTMIGHDDWVNSAFFSPDGRNIVSASEDGTIRIWDVSSGKNILTIEGHTATVWTASYSPDGSRIISTSLDGTIRIWNATNGDNLQTIMINNDYSQVAVFSHNGRFIVGTSGKTINIWESPSLQELMNENFIRFKENPLTSEERKLYYLEKQ